MKRGLVRTVQKFRAGLRQAGGFSLVVPARFTEEQQHSNEHQEYAQRRHAKDVLHPQALVHIGGDVGPGSARRCSPACSKWNSQWNGHFPSRRARWCRRRWVSPARFPAPAEPERMLPEPPAARCHESAPATALPTIPAESRSSSRSGRPAKARGGSPSGRRLFRRRPPETTPARRRIQ